MDTKLCLKKFESRGTCHAIQNQKNVVINISRRILYCIGNPYIILVHASISSILARLHLCVNVDT